MKELVTYKSIREGKQIDNEALVEYVNNKIKVIDLLIKKIKEKFFEVNSAIALLQKQGYQDTFLLINKLEKRRFELGKI